MFISMLLLSLNYSLANLIYKKQAADTHVYDEVDTTCYVSPASMTLDYVATNYATFIPNVL